MDLRGLDAKEMIFFSKTKNKNIYISFGPFPLLFEDFFLTFGHILLEKLFLLEFIYST